MMITIITIIKITIIIQYQFPYYPRGLSRSLNQISIRVKSKPQRTNTVNLLNLQTRLKKSSTEGLASKSSAGNL